MGILKERRLKMPRPDVAIGHIFAYPIDWIGAALEDDPSANLIRFGTTEAWPILMKGKTWEFRMRKALEAINPVRRSNNPRMG